MQLHDLTVIERCRFPRYPFHVRATLMGQWGEMKVHLLDISRHGALVLVPQDWTGAVNEQCDLVVPVMPGEHLIRPRAAVAHVRQRVVGLTCGHLDLKDLVKLKRLVEMNLGHPAALERPWGALVRSVS